MKKILKIILITCIFFYTVFLLILYFFQNSLVYFPGQENFSNCDYFIAEETKIYKNTRFYERKGEKDWVIVFFHGNAWRACDRQTIASIFEKSGYSYILVEYSWYAEWNTDITPDIADILQNVDDMEEYLSDSWYGKVIAAWRSIGTWPASLLAWKINSEKLFLLSPYSQLYKVAADKYPIFPIKQLFTQNYNSEKYLENYTWEVLIIHGDRDSVVPQVFWKELYNWLKTGNKQFFDVEWWNHNNELYIEGVIESMLKFIR